MNREEQRFTAAVACAQAMIAKYPETGKVAILLKNGGDSIEMQKTIRDAIAANAVEYGDSLLAELDRTDKSCKHVKYTDREYPQWNERTCDDCGEVLP